MSRAHQASPAFADRVLLVVRAIPPGRVATYGDVAELSARPGAARAVGTVMARCRDHTVPCHRVVAAGGRLGGFGGHESMKRHLLAMEGCAVLGRHIQGFADVRWTGSSPRASRRARQTAWRLRTS